MQSKPVQVQDNTKLALAVIALPEHVSFNCQPYYKSPETGTHFLQLLILLR